MGLLAKAYNSENSPHIATVVLSIGSALLFSVGVFMIVHAQFTSQAKTLKSAQATINELANKKDAEFDTLTVNEESNLNGDLNVGGTTTLSGDLSVSGAGEVSTVLGVDGDTNFDQTLNVKGGVLLKGDLSVLAATTLQSSLAVGGDASLGEGLTVGGSVKTAGDFSSSGATTIGGSVSVGGDTTFDLSTGGTFNLRGGFSTSGDLSVAGTTVLQQALSVTGSDSTSTFDGTGTSATGTILLGNGGPTFSVQGSTALNGELTVNGVTLINGTLSLLSANPSSPDFNPSSTFDGTGSSTVNGVTSTILLGSDPTLQVTSGATLQGDMTVNGTARFGTLAQSGVTGCTQTADIYCLPSIEFDATGSNGTNTVLLDTTRPSFYVQGDASFVGSLAATGTSSFAGNFTQTALPAAVCSSVSVSTLDCSVSVEFDASAANPDTTTGFYVTKDTSVVGGLTVTGKTYLNGNFTQSALPVGQCTQSDSVDCIPDVNFDASAADPNNTIGFQVQGTTTVTGSVTITGRSLLDSTLTVSGSADFDGNLHVICTQNCSDVFTHVGGEVDADYGYKSKGYIGQDFYAGKAPVSGNKHDCTGSYIRGINVYGGIVTSGECSDVGVTPDVNGTPDANCSSGARHIRITEVKLGIITGATCALDAGPGADFYDLAENYDSSQPLAPGDVVRLDPSQPEKVLKSSSVNDELVIGVVSTAPGYTLGSGGPGYPIALSGRVPVKVNNEGGAIIPGDYLTTSSVEGVAKKAGPNDKTIGQALAAFNDQSGTVMMFVSVNRSTPTPQQSLQNSQSLNLGVGNFSDLNVSGSTTITDLIVTGSATIQELKVIGLAQVANIDISGHVKGNNDTRGVLNIPAGQTTVHQDFLKPYDSDPAVVASPVGQAVNYSVNSTKTGFDISIPSVSQTDIKFNYMVQQ